MAFPDHKEAEAYTQFENSNDWACPRCFKKISASRPPIFKADSCSCDKVATYHISNGYYSDPTTFDHTLYNAEVTAPIYHNQAQSVASSSASVPCPESREIEHPDLQLGNAYLPLVAAPGLNEDQHKRSASFHSDMSYPLQRFLGELRTHPVYDTEHIDHPSISISNSNFLSQELYLQSSKKTKKGRGSPHSKLSWMSSSLGSGSKSVESWGMGMDQLVGAGMWDEGIGSGYGNTGGGNGYAMVLSGMTECAVFEDEVMI